MRIQVGSSRRASVSESAFTLIELLLVIAIMAMLIGLAMPMLRGTRERARDALCMNNLRQVAVGLVGYASESRNEDAMSYLRLYQ